jgi:hypothetical protein
MAKFNDYVKDKWADLVLGAGIIFAMASVWLAYDIHKTKSELNEVLRTARQEYRMALEEKNEVKKGIGELTEKLTDIERRNEALMRIMTSVSDNHQPANIAGFEQYPEKWGILPRPANCLEQEGRLYFQLRKEDIIGETANGDCLIEFKQDGEFDLIGVKIGESGWCYGRPGKAIPVRMGGDDFKRHIEGKDVKIQVMGLNKPLGDFDTEPYIVTSSYVSDKLI